MSRPGIKKPLEEKLEKPCAAAMRRLSVPWFRWGIILFSLALAGASIYYTLGHLTVNTSRKDLISGSQRLIERSDLIDRDFGGKDGLVVVVENVNRAQSVRFAKALATELRRDPERFPDLFYRLNPDSFKPWALLYPEVDDLQKLKDNLAGQKKLLSRLAAEPRLATFYGLVNEQIAQAMIGTAFTGFLQDEQTAGTARRFPPQRHPAPAPCESERQISPMSPRSRASSPAASAI